MTTHPRPIVDTGRDLAVAAILAEARRTARACKRHLIALYAMPFGAPLRTLGVLLRRGALNFIGPIRALPVCVIALALAYRERFAATDANDHA